MKRRTAIRLLGTLACAQLAHAALAAPPIDVFGQDDAAVDHALIQSAIDQAPDGGQVRLHGTFQLDGQPVLIRRGELTIRGVTIDQDGDGRENEDWADGVDNDGDGLLDEDDWDAELVGLEDGNGRPATDPLVPFFNHGLQVTALDHEAEDLRIRDLAFRSLVAGVGLLPDVAFETTTRCEGISSTAGRLVEPRIEKNRFFGNVNGIWVRGDVEGARIKGNVAEANLEDSIDMLGVSQLCIAEAGGGGTVFYGTPTDTEIKSNRLDNISTTLTAGTEIRGNRVVLRRVVPLVMFFDRDISIVDNELVGGLTVLLFDITEGTIKDNTIEDALVGFFVDGPTNGLEIKDNHFDRQTPFVDISLGSNTFSNRVVVGPDVVVENLGTDNEVIVEE